MSFHGESKHGVFTIVNLNVMEKDAVIFVSVPVLRIRMKQVIKIESFSTFSGKRFERILSQDRTHESYFEVKVDTDETRMNWRVRGVDQQVCADVDVMFSVLPNDPKVFSVVYDQPAASYKCSANAGQVYSLTLPTKQITEAIDPASPVTFQVDYQIVSVLKPVIGDVLAEPSDSRFPPKTAAFYMKSRVHGRQVHCCRQTCLPWTSNDHFDAEQLLQRNPLSSECRE